MPVQLPPLKLKPPLDTTVPAPVMVPPDCTHAVFSDSETAEPTVTVPPDKLQALPADNSTEPPFKLMEADWLTLSPLLLDSVVFAKTFNTAEPLTLIGTVNGVEPAIEREPPVTVTLAPATRPVSGARSVTAADPLTTTAPLPDTDVEVTNVHTPPTRFSVDVEDKRLMPAVEFNRQSVSNVNVAPALTDTAPLPITSNGLV